MSDTDNKSIKIGLYLLERNDTPMPDEWGRCVVAACSEKAARELANQESKAEGYVWTDGHLVDCTHLGSALDGIDGVIIFSRDMKE